jgi:saccharopine dehydrogenase (NAD+, L-lysine-forming)
MTDRPALWLRHESRDSEQRTPIVPADARTLIARGVSLTVERSPHRVFPIAEYADAGCRIAEPGSWVDAPADSVVVGLKELPAAPAELRHRHVMFGHAYKGQPGAVELLRRFVAGGGELLDLEYLVDDAGRRLTAFGYWAGYVGAALAVLSARGTLTTPLRSLTREVLDGELADRPPSAPPRALVIGALGRSGHGARDALAVAGIEPTRWDIEETRALDKEALLGHDILVNTVYTDRPATPFVTGDDVVDPGRRLATIVDVTCDAGSPYNLLPLYDTVTDWQAPVRRLVDETDGPAPLDLIAIDNLPSLLPVEASIGFSADLAPHLLTLNDPDSAWRGCRARFRAACEDLEVRHG